MSARRIDGTHFLDTMGRERRLIMLDAELRRMREGDSVDIDRVNLQTFFPNPDIFRNDDHLEPAARCQKWCEHYDVTYRVNTDPPGLHFFKPYTLRGGR